MNCGADYYDDNKDEFITETLYSCSCSIQHEKYENETLRLFDDCPCCVSKVTSRNGKRVQIKTLCSSAAVPLTKLTALAGQKKQTLAEWKSGFQSWRQNNSRICGPIQCWVRGKCCDLIGTKTGHRCPIHCWFIQIVQYPQMLGWNIIRVKVLIRNHSLRNLRDGRRRCRRHFLFKRK